MAFANLTPKEIEDLAEEALNAACVVMQNRIGQTDGGTAALFFSDDEVKNAFMEYVRHEVWLSQE